jgi:hypothetical protein
MGRGRAGATRTRPLKVMSIWGAATVEGIVNMAETVVDMGGRLLETLLMWGSTGFDR